ncbi:hypothetical protein CULT_640006 [[Clostridium] ultunense Esp]|nr:hypothetical protein CULT_640006 [[Clostridium] ultunense Esp]
MHFAIFRIKIQTPLINDLLVIIDYFCYCLFQVFNFFLHYQVVYISSFYFHIIHKLKELIDFFPIIFKLPD